VSFYRLNNQLARQAACRAVLDAPAGWICKVTQETRSLEANALLHALLAEISAKEKWAGELRDKETWKRLLTCAWMRATNRNVEMLPAVDGHGFDVLYRRTSTLSVREMNELIEYIQCWWAEKQA
jgi:hypothetical protein